MTVFRFPLVVAESGFHILLYLPRLPRLAEENTALRTELSSARVEAARLQETVRQFARSQELRAAAHQGAAGPVASIIGRTIVPTQHVVIIDKGRAQGIARDGAVLDVSGLVGRILDVHPARSLVMLVTDPDSRIACMIERSRESGLLAGTGGALCRLTYLDVDADVQVDDRIVTAGLGGPLPKGLALGTVVKIERNSRTAQTTAWVRPAVRLNQVESVLYLPPSTEK